MKVLGRTGTLGRINGQATLVGKSLFVFENNASVYRTLGLLSTLPSLGH